MSEVSVLVLTKDEEQNLRGCLESVAWSNDVHVFDSFSTDGTVALAQALGAQVHQRSFDGYASQRNAALREIQFAHEWVLVLDADERATQELAKEVAETVRSVPKGVAAFRIRRRDFLYGRWLKHVQASPFYVRLIRLGRVHYEREVNEIVRVEGMTGQLASSFDHFPFSKGMAHWLAKHNAYSTMEAEELLRSRRGRVPPSVLRALFERDFNKRRFHQKELFYRLPARPMIRFLILYVLKFGFLDGRAGYTYAKLQSIYETMIVLKTRELEQEGRQ